MSAVLDRKIDFIDLKGQYRDNKARINERIQRVLDHGQYIMGPEVAELEGQLARYVGTAHCIGVSDGTTALQIAMMALGIGPGDEVITTPFTFIATAEMISIVGARPVFVDIDPRTYNIDPQQVEAAITPRTRAIMPVSLYGQCADMDAINAIAARHSLPVIEDAAQSFGAIYKGRRSCGVSTIATTSFFPSKPLGCYGDGGACFTSDDALAAKMREIRVHGQSKRYVHSSAGLNGRLDTLQAAILLAKFELFPAEALARAAVASRYCEKIDALGLPDVVTPYIEPFNTSVYAQFTVRVPRREAVARALGDSGVPTAVHYPVPLHRQPVYASGFSDDHGFPHAEVASTQVMSLPMYPGLDEETQDFIVAALARALG